MRTIKILPLAVAAALALMAAVTSASAIADETTLCKTTEVPCSKANTFPAGTPVGGVGGSKSYAGTSFSVTTTFAHQIACGFARIGAATSAEAGNPLPAESGEVFTSACTREEGKYSCGSSETSSPPGSIAATSSGNGTLTMGSSANHFSFSCEISGQKCTWGTAGLALGFNLAAQTFSAKEAYLAKEAGPISCGGALLTTTIHAVSEGGLTYPTYAFSHN